MRTYELLRAVLACVLLRLEQEGRPVNANCAQIVLPGQGVTRIGMADAGQAWVRLRGGYDGLVAGQANSDPDQCAGYLGATIEVGILRCFQLPKRGRELPPAQVQASALLQLQDMESIRAALICCDALTKGDWVLGNYVPLGPAGPDLGGYWTFDFTDAPEGF